MGTPQYGAPPPQYPQAAGYGAGGFGGYGLAPLRPADVGKRIVAAVIDFAVVFAIIVVVFVLSILLSNVRLGIIAPLLWLGAWVIAFLYKPYFEVNKSGQTPGKKIQNIRVVKDDGTPVDWGAALLRQLLLWALGIIELVVMLVQNDRKRLGDMVAKTSVVEASSASVPSAQPAGYGQQPGYVAPQPQPGGYAPPQQPAVPPAPQPPQVQSQVPPGYPQPQPQPGQVQPPAPGPTGMPPAPQPPGGQPPPPGYPSG